MTLWARIKYRLNIIQDCKAEWKKFSTKIAALAAATFALIQAFPSLAIEAWQAVPDDLRSLIPHQDKFALIVITLILVVKFINQDIHHRR